MPILQGRKQAKSRGERQQMVSLSVTVNNLQQWTNRQTHAVIGSFFLHLVKWEFSKFSFALWLVGSFPFISLLRKLFPCWLKLFPYLYWVSFSWLLCASISKIRENFLGDLGPFSYICYLDSIVNDVVWWVIVVLAWTSFSSTFGVDFNETLDGGPY